MSVASELGALSTAFNFSLRITEKVYDIIAVRQEAQDLLEITSRTSTKLQQAKVLRRKKSHLLNDIEKSMILDAFNGTEKAIQTVATIIEPARADLDVTGGRDAGKVRLTTRLTYVFRDATQIPVSLQKLNIANNDLNTAIITLNLKTGTQCIHGEGSTPFISKSPPTYHESEFLHNSRQRNVRRRESSASLQLQRERSPSFMSDRAPTPVGIIAELPDDRDDSAELSDSSDMYDGNDPWTARHDGGVPLPPTPARTPNLEVPQARPLKGRARSQAWLERRMATLQAAK